MSRNTFTIFGGVVRTFAILVAGILNELAGGNTASLLIAVQSELIPAGFPVAKFLAHWWVFPASIVFSMIALSSGVSGALFFSPFFILVVGLSPAQAIGAGLMTEVFGMGNGLVNYVRQRVVDYPSFHSGYCLPFHSSIGASSVESASRIGDRVGCI